MNTNTIESAVRRICQEIHPSGSRFSWPSASEAELLFELVACILGSQVPYEVALAAAKEIRNTGLLETPTKRYCIQIYEKAIYNLLSQPLQHPDWAPTGRRYRFPRIRANQISRTVWAIYSDSGSLQERLRACKNATEARRSIIAVGVGIGPKQASLFLRNIDFTDELAILDSHVLRFMGLCGQLCQATKPISSLQTYESHETHLRNYAQRSGYSLGCIDQAIWIVMRVYLQEAKA
jgi:N-glycosylase/DNA lyase